MIPSGVLCVDRINPAVAITSPAAGNVSGVITISANASDNDQIASLQFKIDGNNLGSALTAAPFQMSYDTTGIVNGNHTISVVTLDRVGNQSTDSRVVTIRNLPVVAFTNPTNGSNVSGTITLSATVTGYGSGITVQFQRDGANIGPAMNSGPYQYNFDTRTVVNGAHTFSVVATDAQGNSTTVTNNVTFKNMPAVSMTSPANGASVSGTITVAATVTGYGSSISVQFKVDGNNIGGAISAAPFQVSYDTHLLNATGHTFSVVATDNLGNSTTVSNSVTVVNTAPSSGHTLLGDWQLWDDGSGSYSSGRNYLPNYNDRDNWNWIWQNTGAKFGYVYLPGNPDPTHYQMYGQLCGSRLEGGAIGILINGAEQASQAPGQFNYQGGQTWSFNGGEQIGGRCWINSGDPNADEQANTFFEQGIGIAYWFGIKAGYSS